MRTIENIFHETCVWLHLPSIKTVCLLASPPSSERPSELSGTFGVAQVTRLGCDAKIHEKRMSGAAPSPRPTPPSPGAPSSETQDSTMGDSVWSS